MTRIIIFFTLLFVTTCYSQQVSYVHGHSNDDRAYSVALNGKGGYVLAGSERYAADSSERIVVMNISLYGNTIWKTVIDGPHHEVAEHIEKTADGGYIVTGTRWDLGYGRSDMYLLKLNKDGEIEWDNYYGGNHRDEGFCVKQTSDNGFVMTGFTKSDIGTDVGQLYVVKVDLSGVIQWERKLGDFGKDYAFDVQELAMGNYLITGEKSGFHGYSTFEFKHPDSDVFIVSLDADGTLIWQNYYGGVGNELAYESVEMPDGGIAVIGSTQSFGAGSFDMYLLQLDDQGNELSSATFGGTGFDYGRSIDRFGDYLFLAGSVNLDTNSNKTDVRIIKTDLNGSEIWSYYFGGEESEYAYKVRALKDGGCVVVGSTRSFGNGGEDMFLLRLSSEGEVILLKTPLNEKFYVYPNPTADFITFEVNDDRDCLKYTYEVIDETGRVVYATDKSITSLCLDVSKYSSGVYLVRVTSLCDFSQYRSKFWKK